MAVLRSKGHKLEQMDHWNQIAAILVGAPALGAPPRDRDKFFGAIDPRLPVGTVQGY